MHQLDNRGKIFFVSKNVVASQKHLNGQCQNEENHRFRVDSQFCIIDNIYLFRTMCRLPAQLNGLTPNESTNVAN